MKAYVYRKRRNSHDYICSTFNNSNENVTIYHDSDGIYQQHWQTGNVEYKSIVPNLKNSLDEVEAVETEMEVGHVIEGVWRPGLCLDVQQALNINENERNRARNDLKILIDKLYDVLLYIEPDQNGLETYSHKIRELLIIACTEVENYWTAYFRMAGNINDRLNTNDYVKLCDKLKLNEYALTFKSHPIHIDLKPFENWSTSNPTASLPWYNAYNKTKHNKTDEFSSAKLKYCIEAVSANIILFAVKYSPYAFLDNNDICSSLIKEYFTIKLIQPKISTFYVPYIKSVLMASGAFSAPKGSTFEKKWSIEPFSV